MNGEIISSFFSLLMKCPSSNFENLFHRLIDAYCGCKNVAYEDYSDVWTLVEWWDLVGQSEMFFKSFHGSSELSTLMKPLPSEVQNKIKECLEIRKVDLQKVLTDKSHSICPNYLADFDWKLKLTLASDKMAQINEPRLQLDLSISGDKEEMLQLDLSKEETKMLIEAMEKAKPAVLDYLNTE